MLNDNSNVLFPREQAPLTPMGHYEYCLMGNTTQSVELSNGQFTLVDAEDYLWLKLRSWRNHDGYAATTRIKPNGKPAMEQMHRLILSHHGSDLSGKCVDHISHDTLDNRKANLRLCTRTENNRYSRPRKQTISQLKGVLWVAERNRFKAKITADHREIYLGHYVDKYVAAQVYNMAAAHYFGAFAWLNPIPSEHQLAPAQLLTAISPNAKQVYALALLLLAPLADKEAA